MIRRTLIVVLLLISSPAAAQPEIGERARVTFWVDSNPRTTRTAPRATRLPQA